jgi:two-component system NtrC family sensor kinase
MIIKADYTITKANKALAKMAGLHIKDVVNKKCFELFANSTSPCKNCKLFDVVKTCKSQTFNLEKSDQYFEVTSQPLFDKKGELSGIVQVYRERTEAKKLQEQLVQSEKLASIGLLAGGIAHEINNPLGGILIFAQMLEKELPEESTHLSDFKEIITAAKRCKSIVENLLDFARSKTYAQPIKEKINLVDTIKTALRLSSVGATNNNTVNIIENYSDDEALYIHGDRNKFTQVFLNIIQNAYQAMPDGGTLTITGKALRNGSLVFDIEDTGIGIPEEQMSNIFDPFFTTKDIGKGTGLGLAICYGIISELSGSIDVKSSVNKGSTFTITIPLKAEIEERASA